MKRRQAGARSLGRSLPRLVVVGVFASSVLFAGVLLPALALARPADEDLLAGPSMPSDELSALDSAPAQGASGGLASGIKRAEDLIGDNPAPPPSAKQTDAAAGVSAGVAPAAAPTGSTGDGHGDGGGAAPAPVPLTYGTREVQQGLFNSDSVAQAPAEQDDGEDENEGPGLVAQQLTVANQPVAVPEQRQGEVTQGAAKVFAKPAVVAPRAEPQPAVQSPLLQYAAGHALPGTIAGGAMGPEAADAAPPPPDRTETVTETYGVFCTGDANQPDGSVFSARAAGGYQTVVTRTTS